MIVSRVLMSGRQLHWRRTPESRRNRMRDWRGFNRRGNTLRWRRASDRRTGLKERLELRKSISQVGVPGRFNDRRRRLF
jgi:hypothetical protein